MTPKHAEIHEYLLSRGFVHESNQKPQAYSALRTAYSVYKHANGSGFAVQKSGQWHMYGLQGRLRNSSPGGLDTLKRSLES